MLKRITTLSLLIIVLLGPGSGAFAASSGSNYLQGQVISVKQQPGQPEVARVKLAGGQTVDATLGGLSNTLDVAPPAFKPGNVVILEREAGTASEPSYTIIDHYRLASVGWIFALIVVLAIIFAGWRGVGSLLGLLLSVAVLAAYVIPQSLKTGNPYPPTIVGAIVISGVGIYLAHGFSRRTTLALISSYLTLALAIGVSIGTVGLLHLNGISSDNIYYLQQLKPSLNIAGLLACGIIISMVGVLDDITVGQATAVEELHRANPALTKRQLYQGAAKIGREHIASLINTLVLAYVGTSMLFVAYITTVSPYPFWITLNSGSVMEEVVRALVASITLILAVPTTTLISARFLPTSLPVKPT